MRRVFLIFALLFGFVTIAATNDVVQCWAVTQSGNRCKRRAAVGERYCKQHSADRMPVRQPDYCRSMTTNGVQCTSSPLHQCSYCQEHLK